MSSKHLLNLLRLGEGVQVEFKQRMPKLNRMAKTFSAFSNSSGGRVFFGVNDEGQIMPLENADGTVELAQQVAHFYCKPAIEVEAELIEVSPGEHILSVNIEESDEKPIYRRLPTPETYWPKSRLLIGAWAKWTEHWSTTSLGRIVMVSWKAGICFISMARRAMICGSEAK